MGGGGVVLELEAYCVISPGARGLIAKSNF